MIFSNLLQQKEISIEDIETKEKGALSEIAKLCKIKTIGKSKVSQKLNHNEVFTQNDHAIYHELDPNPNFFGHKWKLRLNLFG